MMKLGHISDLHILELDDPRPWQFLNKRLVGGANLLFRRSKSHSSKVVREALKHLDEDCGVDHIAITGDLSNLALASEFAAARKIVSELRQPEQRVTVIPGNHDYYTYETARKRRFERYFSRYMRSDLPDYQTSSGYPFCKLLDDVAIIGMNSAIPTPWFFATGEVDELQLEAAWALLDDARVRDRFKVVMIHHHLLPFEHSRSEYSRRLINADDVLEMLRWRDVDLAIHGHNHHFATIELPHLRGDGTLRVCEAGSTSVGTYDDPYFGGKFNVYHIEDGRLARIETHLFESHDVGFVEWKDQSFEQEFDN
ncbi:MAG: metallophosphoesterase family protein [Persicimonas sp.]